MANLMNSNPMQNNASKAGLTPQMEQALDQLRPIFNMMNAGNTPNIEKEVISQFPQFGAFMGLMNGKNPDAILQQMLKQNGISMEDVMNYLKQSV